MREWRARLLTQRLTEEVRLPRLTLAQTATVTSAVLGRAAPAGVVAAIHDRSDGIPLHAEELLAAVASVADAAYLFPFLLTGVRARLARAEVDLAAARATLERTAARWQERRRFWEGTWARLDQARCAVKARRLAEAATLARDARALAVQVGAHPMVAEADRLLAAAAGNRAAHPWSPLSVREFEVARLVAAGNTNRQIAVGLFLSPKTVGSHVEHILAKLGVARRAEIAAWVASLPSASTPAGD